MRRNTLLIDAGIAALLAILVVLLSPGLAVVGLLAILVLLICALSLWADRRRRRSRRDPGRELASVRELGRESRRMRTASRRAGQEPRRPRPDSRRRR